MKNAGQPNQEKHFRNGTVSNRLCVFAVTFQVLRDKQVKSMDAVEIVPGDILLVRLGDIVPADIKILGETAEDEEEAPMQVLCCAIC